MQLKIAFVNTSEIPATLEFINYFVPSVLDTKCFNDQNLPFNIEITSTEIGHLFEHILIDELCKLRINSGASSAVFSGNTSWNWKLNPYGSFSILIDVGESDMNLLIQALRKTIIITKQLIGTRTETLGFISQKNLRATL